MRWICLFGFLAAALPTAASASTFGFELGVAPPSTPRLHLLDRDLTLGDAAAAASLIPTRVVDHSLFGATHHSEIRSDLKPVLALVLGLVVGFGT